jgi:phosphate transport system permease protein
VRASFLTHRELRRMEPMEKRSVSDFALPAAAGIAQPIPASLAKALSRLRVTDRVFHSITRTAAFFVLFLLSAIIVSLIIGAAPALQKFGFGFLTSERWNPVTENFGALAPIYGTVVTSIIYGIWGLFVLAPFLQAHVQPFLIDAFGSIPVLNVLFAGPPYGIGILTSGIILAIMVLPFITSVSRDVFEAVPPILKEAAYGLGFTTWEVVRYVVLPYARAGVIGGIMLGLGRALGETMAVTFVIRNAHKVSSSLLAPGTTIASTIANEFTEAVGDIYTSSLIALGFLLFVITFAVLAAARYMLMQIEKRQG